MSQKASSFFSGLMSKLDQMNNTGIQNQQAKQKKPKQEISSVASIQMMLQNKRRTDEALNRMSNADKVRHFWKNFQQKYK